MHIPAIADAKDFHKYLNRTAQNYFDDPYDIDRAVTVALAGWSMVDWAFHHHPGHGGYPKSSLRDFQDAVKAKCPELAYLQDKATQQKHAQITRYAPKVDKLERHDGAFSAGFSDAFDVTMLALTLTDGSTMSLKRCVGEVTKFWDSYFSSI